MGTKINPAPNDCYAKALADEPMFILLARDDRAAPLVEAWADISEQRGTDPAKVAEARVCASKMRVWRKHNLERAKRSKGSPVDAQRWAESAALVLGKVPSIVDVTNFLATLLESFGESVRARTIGELGKRVYAESKRWTKESEAEAITVAFDVAVDDLLEGTVDNNGA